MGLLRERLAGTRQMMNDYRTANRPDRSTEKRVPEQVR
jgi:hypothetical protein